MTDDEIEKILRKKMDAELDAVFGVSTATTANESVLTPEKLKAAMTDWDKLLRNARRQSVTFVVEQAHEGPMIRHDTPNDGTRIELSWQQANAVHKHWPLRLHRVLATDSAEFVPLTMGEFCSATLPMPPYEVPPDESFTDWVNGDVQ